MLLLLYFYSYNTNAQQFLDKKFYLVDSLDTKIVTIQDKKLLDSCLKVYHKATIDTFKNRVLYDLIELSYNEKIWTRYNLLLKKRVEQMLRKKNLNPKIKNACLKKLSSTYNNIGYYFKLQGEIDSAIANYERSKVILTKLNDLLGLATNYNNVGFVYFDYGNISKALDYFNKAIKCYSTVLLKGTLREKREAESNLATVYNNIALVSSRQNDFATAEKYYTKSLKLKEKLNDKGGVALAIGNLGSILINQAKVICNEKNDSLCVESTINRGMDYLRIALKYDEDLGYLSDYGRTLHNIGIAYKLKGNLDSAYYYYYESVKTKRINNDKNGLCMSLEGMADILFEKRKFEESKKLALESYALSSELGFPSSIQINARLLSKIYARENDYKNAFQFYTLFIKMRDSVNNLENSKLAFRQNMQLEYEKKKVTDSVANARTTEIKDAKIKAQQSELSSEKNKKIAMFTGLLSLLAIAFLLFNRFRATQKQKNIIQEQKKLVEEKQHEIIDSINYAQRLQHAILATETDIQSVFKEFFLIYLPKDIVAGDFYFFDKTETHAFIAAADCTGHGVPGAMVSVICSNALTQCIHEYKLSKPGEILDKTRELVIDTFKKSGQEVKDGMDISLLTKNLTTGQYEWAGANNSVFIFTPESGLKQEIASDKQPVGMTDIKRPFTTHALGLKPNDWIFLYTDGYHDQFGTPKTAVVDGKKPDKAKKLKKSNMYEIFQKHVQSDVNIYKQQVLDRFYQWKGDFEQIDDVCIIGIKI